MPTVHFFWDPVSDSILQERDENGNVVVEYAREPDGTLISENREGVERQYHFDPMGNVLALTDDNQNVTDTFAYNASGEQTERTGTTPTPYRYHGQQGYYFDENTGEYYVQRRDLDPSQGRWLSVDPLRFLNPPLPTLDNPYSYVGNQPTMKIDPTGMAPGTPVSYLICKQLCDQAYNKPWQFIERMRCNWSCWTKTVDIWPPGTEGTVANYGRYCGPARGRYKPFNFCLSYGPTATINLKAMKNACIEPWDDVDYACAVHDCCLGTETEFLSQRTQATCNRILCETLRDYGVEGCSKSPTKKDCLAAVNSILNFSPFCAATPK